MDSQKFTPPFSRNRTARSHYQSRKHVVTPATPVQLRIQSDPVLLGDFKQISLFSFISSASMFLFVLKTQSEGPSGPVTKSTVSTAVISGWRCVWVCVFAARVCLHVFVCCCFFFVCYWYEGFNLSYMVKI